MPSPTQSICHHASQTQTYDNLREANTLTSTHSRPDNLLLQDDPDFIPELTLSLDFDPHPSTQHASTSHSSQLFSPHTLLSSKTSHHSPYINPQIVIPPSASSVSGFGLGVVPGGSLGGSVGGEVDRGHGSVFGVQEGEGLLDDLGFAFDEEGNFIDVAATGAGGASVPPSRRPSQNTTSAIHDTPRPPILDDALIGASDHNQDIFIQDTEHLPPLNLDDENQDASAFPPRIIPPTQPSAQAITTSSITSAPLARRHAKSLPFDLNPSLHSRDLSTWNDTYIPLMTRLSHQKALSRAPALARKNAEFWVWSNGVGGLGSMFGGAEGMPEVFGAFVGEGLMRGLLGQGKRGREEDEGDGEERRVRRRTSEDAEVGRGGLEGEVGMFDAGGHDDTLEQARPAPTPLPELHSSAQAQLPWNILASARSSHHSGIPFNLNLAAARGTSSSIGGAGGVFGGFIIPSSHHSQQPRDLSRPGRTISASPLHNRGLIHENDNDILQLLGSDDQDFGNLAPAPGTPGAAQIHTPALAPGSAPGSMTGQPGLGPDVSQTTSFALHGPAANVSTQMAGDVQWVSDILTTESLNFLAFVRAGIEAQQAQSAQQAHQTQDEQLGASRVDDEGDDEAIPEEDTRLREEISFEVLLPQAQNTNIVAAQGFLHVLTLGTRNLLRVRQAESFGAINLSLI